MRYIGRYEIKMMIFFVGFFISGCHGANQTHTPNLDIQDYYNFKIDSSLISVSVPAGGVKGGYTVYDFDTSSTKEKLIFLIVIGYDFDTNSTAYFSTTHFSMGLTTDGCCDVLRILKGKQENESTRGSTVKNYGDRKWVYVEYSVNEGDLGAAYYSIFNEKYVLFLNMRVDGSVADKEKVFFEKIKTLARVVEDLKIKEVQINGVKSMGSDSIDFDDLLQ